MHTSHFLQRFFPIQVLTVLTISGVIQVFSIKQEQRKLNILSCRHIIVLKHRPLVSLGPVFKTGNYNSLKRERERERERRELVGWRVLHNHKVRIEKSRMQSLSNLL